MDASEISVAELRSALTGPLDAVEERFGPELRFPEDFYRNVPMGEATKVDRDPKLDVGRWWTTLPRSGNIWSLTSASHRDLARG